MAPVAMSKAGEPRTVWASALLALLHERAWPGAASGPPDRDALIKAFAERLRTQREAPGEPEKAVRTWIDGTAPFSKGFYALCRALFGDDFEKHGRYTELHSCWKAAATSKKPLLVDAPGPAKGARAASVPESMTRLAWTPTTAWQSMGLAELIVGHPQFRNDREGYRLFVSVSFGSDRFSVDRRGFIVRLRAAWLEPDYHNCHPVPGSRPGDTNPHANIAILGGQYQFRGPKIGGEFLVGNPFGVDPGLAEANDPDVDDTPPSTVAFAEIAWNRPGANSVRLTLSSGRSDLDIVPSTGQKPLSRAREKLIQHYLRKAVARNEGDTIHWARATLQGKVRE